MEPVTNNENRIFIDAFIGAVLFIATLAFANLSIATFRLSYTIVAGILGISSLWLLYKAIKNDRSRVKV